MTLERVTFTAQQALHHGVDQDTVVVLMPVAVVPARWPEAPVARYWAEAIEVVGLDGEALGLITREVDRWSARNSRGELLTDRRGAEAREFCARHVAACAYI